MRKGQRLAAATVLAVSAGLTHAGWADFNPQGRQRRPARPAPAQPAAPRPAAPQKKENPEALIARYRGIVLSRPDAQFPLQRLAQLYRERDGNLDRLIEDFEKRAAAPGSSRWNALVALAGIYRQDAQHDRAVATYEQAIAEKPGDPVAVLALAHLLSDRGDKAAAKARYEEALPGIQDDALREQTLRTLMALCLDLKEVDAARKHHRELVRRARGSFFVRAELGRELLLRGEHALAEQELREVVKAAAGDNRALAPALRDLGRALARQQKREEAMSTLRRALRAAGQQSGLRAEIFETIVEVYRAEERLAELIELVEKEKPNDFERLKMLGELYEETGQVDRALETYQKALAKNARDLTTRLKVVQLLQLQGELDAAIAQYEHLIRAAPRNPDFVFRFAEALIQRGDRSRALKQLERLEARSRGEEETLAALVDFYERVDEADRAQALLERLAKGKGTDPRHVVELGARYYREGDEQRALQTWQRIRTLVPDRARALHTLGEVYLEHDMAQRALEALSEAVTLAPKKIEYKKAYALALERTGAALSQAARRRQYEEAQRIWEGLLREAGDNAHLAREARQHIVTLWSLSGVLQQRIPPLERRARQSPPDLEAARILSEVYVRLRRYSDAERTLGIVVGAAPGDSASLLRLERVLVLQRKLPQAVEVLEKLVRLDPKRAREYYQRMAQYATELYRDDDALRYAARAVELSPEDADGHRKLGEMYRQRQETEKAIRELRKAISKNDRLFPVYFQLAELLLNQGKAEEGDALLRRVIRASPDEELIARAARLSMQINLGRGTLESLEKELLPVALGNPQRPVYRRLLVEIYGNLAFPLVHESRSRDPAEAEAARDRLRRIGERAVKPLLDALGDESDPQQRIALELLSHIRNRGAGPALLAYATGPGDPDLRVRAMIAAGALQDPDLLPRFREVLAPEGDVSAEETDPVAVAAAWAVARLKAPPARPLLLAMLDADAPTVRALAALGTALAGSRRDAPRLGEIARGLHQGSVPRAAAAFALGELGSRDQIGALTQLAEATDPTLRATALLALSRLDAKAAPRAVADALVSADPALRSAAVAAALVLATGDFRAGGEILPIPDGRLDVSAILSGLVPDGYEPDEHARALILLSPTLARAAASAVQSSPDRARAVADALLVRGGQPAFGPLTRELEKVAPELQEKAEAAAEAIAAAVVEPFLALARHPAADVRARAIQLLATRSERAAQRAVLDGVDDPDPDVQRATLVALGASGDASAIEAVTRLLDAATDWPIRVQATEAVGRLAGGSQDVRAAKVLAAVAETDAYSLVREAAVKALGAVDPEGARPVLARIAQEDPEPRVREAARALLDGQR